MLGNIQQLINSGMAWRLEGSFGRTAMAYIEAGLAILGPERVTDYYGNTVGSRFDVVRGTKGSIQYANKRLNARYRGKDFDSGLVLAREDNNDEDYD